jgi:uncharacterized SAM-binding protein YcdF (DUF218 family)
MNTNTLFFWISKSVWFVIAPDSLLFLCILCVCILLWRKRYRPARWLLSIIVVVLLIVGLFPLGQWLFFPLETRFTSNPPLPKSVAGIIVLGGGEDALRSEHWQQVEVNDGAERLLAFLKLAKRYPQAKLVFTGGSGCLLDQEFEGASVAKMLLEEHDVDISRLALEHQSRNTYENAIFSKALVNPGSEETWVLITTAWHMPRSVGIFRKVGWPVIPYPVDHWADPEGHLDIGWDPAGNLRDLKIATKEWVGLLSYHVSGKTSALFPDED